jgi:hypothetical protein
MLTTAVDVYLAARRAAGFQLSDHEAILRDFAPPRPGARASSGRAPCWSGCGAARRARSVDTSDSGR